MKKILRIDIFKLIACALILTGIFAFQVSAQSPDSLNVNPPFLTLLAEDSLSVDEGDTLIVNVVAIDLNGVIPTLTAENLMEGAVFIDSANGNGSLIFTPGYEQEGNYTVNIIASDGIHADTATVAIAVHDITIFRLDRLSILIFLFLFSTTILLYTNWAKMGKELFVRKIPGIAAVEEAVGRATEMGKPVLFIPGISDVEDIETIAGLSILGRVSKIIATYGTPLSVPVRYPMVLAAGQEVVEQAYLEAGHHDAYDQDTVRYVAGEQFAFTATVNGWMMREKPAANIYMGAFFAESLLLAETGNAAGAIQIAGTARPEQLPFFIAACDYTLMGEELYAASSYLSREPLLLGGLKGQDFVKSLIVIAIIISLILNFFDVGGWFNDVFNVS